MIDANSSTGVVETGDQLIFDCYSTSYALNRTSMGLKYRFLKNGTVVQDFSNDTVYMINSVQTKDVGSYFCQVISGTVTKNSTLQQINGK